MQLLIYPLTGADCLATEIAWLFTGGSSFLLGFGGEMGVTRTYENHINDSKSDIIRTFIMLNNTCK